MSLAFWTLTAISHAEVIEDTDQTTFAVHCYDVGASALDGLPGIISIEKGWNNFKEINRSVYDPDKITVNQLEDRLKKSGTYLGPVAEPIQGNHRKEIAK